MKRRITDDVARPRQDTDGLIVTHDAFCRAIEAAGWLCGAVGYIYLYVYIYIYI